jgi:hypothetical protein
MLYACKYKVFIVIYLCIVFADGNNNNLVYMPPYHLSGVHDFAYFVDLSDTSAFEASEDSWTCKAAATVVDNATSSSTETKVH